MKIILATNQYSEKVVDFFEKYLDKNNEAVTGREFFCPFGMKAAISRKQMIIIVDDFDNVIASLRFYPRKNDGIVSIYQFAISEKFRKNNLLQEMLRKINFQEFEVLCPIDSDFNEYYKKTGWKIKKKDEKFNYWFCFV